MSTALARIIKREWARKPRSEPTKRPLNVRIARPDEEKKVFDTLMLLGEENALAPINEAKVWEMIRRCHGPKPGEYRDGVMGVIDAQDRSIAAIVGIVMGQWWYTNQWHCEEVFSFVHPDHRRDGNNYPKSLIQFSCWWAEQMGLPLIMGVLSTNRTIGKVSLYSREIPLAGAIFLWQGPRHV